MENVKDIKIISGENSFEVSPYVLARSFRDEDQFAEFYDHFLNMGGKNFSTGERVGKKLQSTHRTLQGLAVNFALGIICGLAGDEKYTDDRNRVAVKTANKIKRMIDDGEIYLQPYI